MVNNWKFDNSTACLKIRANQKIKPKCIRFSSGFHTDAIMINNVVGKIHDLQPNIKSTNYYVYFNTTVVEIRNCLDTLKV